MFVRSAESREAKALFDEALAAAAGHCDHGLTGGSLRPWLNTATAQLRSSDDARRRLGNWAEKSAQPDTYDRRFGVAELRDRSFCDVLDFFRRGALRAADLWRSRTT